jgi:hypothetical protein
MLLNAAALSAVLAHLLIDTHIGIFGRSSPSMAPLQAVNISLTCLVVGWWVLCLAPTTEGARPGLPGALVLAVGWTFLSNGLAAVLLVPPPSDAFPFQDIAHFLDILLGALAAVATWRELRRSGTRWNWLWSGIALLLLVALFVVQATLTSPSSDGLGLPRPPPAS